MEKGGVMGMIRAKHGLPPEEWAENICVTVTGAQKQAARGGEPAPPRHAIGSGWVFRSPDAEAGAFPCSRDDTDARSIAAA